jgi:regulator of replication initiation timing
MAATTHMNTNILPETSPPTRAELDAAIVDSLLTRIADLYSDIEALREVLQASVDLNHKLTEQNARLRICVRRHLWDSYGVAVQSEAAA